MVGLHKDNVFIFTPPSPRPCHSERSVSGVELFPPRSRTMLNIVRSSFHSDFDVAQDDTAEKAQGEAVAESRAFLRRFLHRHLCRRQHILNKDPVPRRRVADHHVGHSADELAVLDDGRARHECSQEGTTLFNGKFTKMPGATKQLLPIWFVVIPMLSHKAC